MTTYKLHNDNIECLICGSKSYNANDIEKRYCGHCHTFHDSMTVTAEELKTPVQIEVDLAIAIAVIANIQLAQRHPGNTGAASKQAQDFARALQNAICTRIPKLAFVLEAGWNSEYDYGSNE